MSLASYQSILEYGAYEYWILRHICYDFLHVSFLTAQNWENQFLFGKYQKKSFDQYLKDLFPQFWAVEFKK